MTPRRKWRPALWMIIFGAVLAVAFAPLVALYTIRGIENAFDVDFRFHTVWDAGLLLVITVLVGLVLAYVASRTLLDPITRLIARTGEIERAQLEGGWDTAFRPLDHYGTREFAVLGDRFGRLARRLSQRNADLVLFSRHLTHELKSPLTGIRGAVELLRDEPDMDAATRDRFLANIAGDAERLGLLADGLRALATAELGTEEGAVDVRGAASAAVASVEGLALAMEGETTLPLGPRNAAIVMEQLAGNAREHGAATLTLAARPGRLLVGDDGAAIPAGDRDRLMEPFFTTKREAGGTGLGLSIAAGVLARHDARLAVSDEPGWKFAISWEARSQAGREPPR